jgi:hypothetical protein
VDVFAVSKHTDEELKQKAKDADGWKKVDTELISPDGTVMKIKSSASRTPAGLSAEQ